MKMSLGYSTVKIVNLAQLALQTVQNAKRACGEHDELTREVTSLHAVLSRLQKTAQQPDSLLNKSDEATKTEIESTVEDCGKVLEVLAKILDKYNSLSEETKAVRKLWTRVRFGNGEMMDLGDLRSKVGTYTSLITLQVNLIALGSQGRVEDHLSRHGSRLKAMQQSINFITASLSTGREASILTIYSGDDKLVWRELRRELVAEGFSSNVISKHKTAIVAYVKDLGDRGIFDELTESETSTPQVITVPAVSRVSRSSLKDVAGKTLRTSLESTNSPPREHWYRRIFRRPNTPDYGLAYRGKYVDNLLRLRNL